MLLLWKDEFVCSRPYPIEHCPLVSNRIIENSSGYLFGYQFNSSLFCIQFLFFLFGGSKIIYLNKTLSNFQLVNIAKTNSGDSCLVSQYTLAFRTMYYLGVNWINCIYFVSRDIIFHEQTLMDRAIRYMLLVGGNIYPIKLIEICVRWPNTTVIKKTKIVPSLGVMRYSTVPFCPIWKRPTKDWKKFIS